MPRVAARLIPVLLLAGAAYILWSMYKERKNSGLTSIEKRNLTWVLVLMAATMIGMLFITIE